MSVNADRVNDENVHIITQHVVGSIATVDSVNLFTNVKMLIVVKLVLSPFRLIICRRSHPLRCSLHQGAILRPDIIKLAGYQLNH